MGRIFERAALREFTNTAGGVFVALFAILLTTQLIRLLGSAAGGRIAPEGVVALLGFGALQYLPIVLSLTLFISILLALSRSYRDSEMVVWFAAGLPLTAWVRPVLRFALPLVAAIAVLSLLLTPWALSKSDEYRKQMESRDDIARVTPGAFAESSSADRIIFVETVAGDEKRVKNIFVSSMQHGRLGIIVSSQGYTQTMANGDRFLVMTKGRRYEGTPGTPEYRVMEFESYAVRVETKEAQGLETTPRNSSTLELLRNPVERNLAELLWRVGVPLSAVVLALLAIPLSFVNPRAGRTNNLLLAILTYMIYSNMISVTQAWVAQGRLQFELGFLVHLLMFVTLILLFFKRLSVFSWVRLRR